jgi:S1-C subfamily serine protease
MPVDTLNQVVPKLIAKSQLEPPRMGFEVLTAYDAQRIGIERGLVVSEVTADSPAGRAGLRPLVLDAAGHLIAMGDILLGYQGEPLENPGQFMALLEYLTIAGMSQDEVVFDVLREGRVIKLVLHLEKKGPGEKPRAQPSSI